MVHKDLMLLLYIFFYILLDIFTLHSKMYTDQDHLAAEGLTIGIQLQ